VEVYTDYYEIVFKVHGAAVYYFGKAEIGSEYLSVKVEAGLSYDILLLAGTKKNRSLLATGFVNYRHPDGTADFDPDGTGYEVIYGVVNPIVLELHKINIDAETDFAAFSGIVDGSFERDDTTKVVSLVIDNDAAAAAGLAGTLTTAKLADLCLAANAAGETAPAFTGEVTLKPRHLYLEEGKYSFNPAPKGTLTVPTSVDDDGLVFNFVFETDNYPWDPVNPDSLRDVDGLLYLKLTYQAFGTAASRSSSWVIGNGLNDKLDRNNTGGAIRVKFDGDGNGKGGPDEDDDEA
jgi:hypothetical protein